jgi:hypothetical protein
MPHVKPDWAHVLGVQLLVLPSPWRRLPSFGLPLPLSLPVEASGCPGWKSEEGAPLPQEATAPAEQPAIQKIESQRPTLRMNIARTPPTINRQLCAKNTPVAMAATSELAVRAYTRHSPLAPRSDLDYR